MNEDTNVKTKLIEIGKKEFLNNGYEKTSMRNISKQCNVSTGAIYFFFKNKEDFFKSIVDETANHLKSLIIKHTKSEINEESTSAENEKEFINYLHKRKVEATILLEKSKGSYYENYKQELSLLLENAYIDFYKARNGNEKYLEIIKIIAKMRIQGYIELINGGFDMEKTIKFSELMSIYGDYGFESMMKYIKESSVE